jgi:prepilin-type N-terminal cleavage/methylation domain-containing protein
MAPFQPRRHSLLEAELIARKKGKFGTAARQRGFTLLEVMFSMVVMTVGLISLLSVLCLAMASTQTSEEHDISKRLANEAIESILTVRETTQYSWSQIANTGAGGIFLSGAQPIDCAGADGIIGTSDDAACGAQVLDMPGPSGIVMTPSGSPCALPDNCLSLTNYTRTIAISPYTVGGVTVNSLDNVVVTITYTDPQLKVPQTYVLTTLISQFR